MGNSYRKLTDYEKNAKKFGTPLYYAKQKVKTHLTGDEILTIRGEAWSNGFCWMYSFSEKEMSCGQDYIIPLNLNNEKTTTPKP